MSFVPPWPGDEPDLTGCRTGREMQLVAIHHSMRQQDHLGWCEGCAECRAFYTDYWGISNDQDTSGRAEFTHRTAGVDDSSTTSEER